jgi:hypothetical protein
VTAHRLLLPADRIRRPAITDFVWGTTNNRSSFLSSIRPMGGGLDVSDPIALDLVRTAIAIFLVDRTARRPTDWQRDLTLEVPVSDANAWNDRAEGLAGLLDYMTGDRWEISFRADPSARRRGRINAEQYDRVCLFSGGADSFAGAVRARMEVDRLLLVGHHDSNAVLGVQRGALDALVRLPGHEVSDRFIQVARKQHQMATGEPFGQEPTSRTRSLLFVALGLATAHSTGAQTLWVPENGWVSINPPLTAERRAALSTRTTHPGLLDELAAMIQSLGIGVTIENPWQGQSKGEVFAWLGANGGVSDEAMSEALSVTHSCARSDARWVGFPTMTHCGVCFACLVRRAAFVSSGIRDATEYIEVQLRSDLRRRAEWLTTTRLRDYAAVRTAVARGRFSTEDILALDLPRRYSPDDALALANRGLAELEAVRLP